MLSKRLFDLLGAGIGLLALAPLLLLISLWIRWDSPGPALFRQWRIGRAGVPFAILKFRTMRTDADCGSGLTIGADPRITRAGAFLRRHKLDELPQLLNVVAGDMSLVGPRPELARYVAHYPAPVRASVLSVRPGLTDWAAIEYKDESAILGRASDPEQAYLEQILPVKLAYYQRYVAHHSVGQDVRIIWCTLAALCLRGHDQ